MKTEDILWQAIKDIETGKAKTIQEDPIDGFLDEKSRRGLTKINVCAQTAKYTKNGKPITRPTLDSYDNIVEYILGRNTSKNAKDEIKELKEKLKKSNEVNSDLKEALVKLSEENYELNEKVKILENRIRNSIKLVD